MGWPLFYIAVQFLSGCNGAELAQLEADKAQLTVELKETQAKLHKAEKELGKLKDRNKSQANIIKEVKSMAQSYVELTEQIRWRAVSLDELCEFFTCDSVQTKNGIRKILQDQSKNGAQGWRILKRTVPEGRIEIINDNKVQVAVEGIEEKQCAKQGLAKDTAEGVRGCLQALPKPWKKKCSRINYTFSKKGQKWKRLGIAYVRSMPCEK